MDNIVTVIITAVISSGITGFVVQSYLKYHFDKKFEKEKVNIEVDKNIQIKISDEKIQVYKKTVEHVHKCKRDARYSLALLGLYFDAEMFKEYKQYLEIGDNVLTKKEILAKIKYDSLHDSLRIFLHNNNGVIGGEIGHAIRGIINGTGCFYVLLGGIKSNQRHDSGQEIVYRMKDIYVNEIEKYCREIILYVQCYFNVNDEWL